MNSLCYSVSFKGDDIEVECYYDTKDSTNTVVVSMVVHVSDCTGNHA